MGGQSAVVVTLLQGVMDFWIGAEKSVLHAVGRIVEKQAAASAGHAGHSAHKKARACQSTYTRLLHLTAATPVEPAQTSR